MLVLDSISVDPIRILWGFTMIRFLSSASVVAILIASQTQAATMTLGDGAVFPASGANGGQIEAGRSSTGSVTIDGGDVVTITSGTSPDELTARPKIDVGDGGTGVVTVTGTGTTVNLDGTNSGSKLEIGTFAGSSGTLEVLDGATINLTDDGPIAGDDNENIFLQFGEDQADGTLVMDNGTINATGHSRVGMLVGISGNTPIAGNGVIDLTNSSINMTNLGDDESSFIVIGNQSNGTGDVDLVSSAIISTTPNDRAFLGLGTDSGNGNVSLTEASELTMSAERLNVVLGDGNGAVAELSADGHSNVGFVSTGEVNLAIGQSAGSDAAINLIDGSTLEVDGTFGRVQIGSDALTTTSGSGLLSVDESVFESSVGIQVGSAFTGPNAQTGEINLNGGTVRAPEIVIGNGGSITGSGTIDAVKTVVSGGLLSPGFSPGILEFTGDLELSSGSFLFEIGGTGPSMFDSILVGGSLLATDVFNIEISFIDGFRPSKTDTFNLFEAASVDASFFSFANFISNSPLSFSSNGGSVGVSFEDFAPVPIPAGLPLLLTGLGGMFTLRSRLRR